MELTIRPETGGDVAAIREVEEAAFGQPDEADLVDRLRDDGEVLLSLVAEVDGRIEGHILFTRLWIDPGSVPAVALAPLAVSPTWQRRGIGGRLIEAGLEVLRQQDERIVFVLGHPSYYPRFGFEADKASLLESPFPRESYMALELVPWALDGIRGRVRYPAAFGLA